MIDILPVPRNQQKIKNGSGENQKHRGNDKDSICSSHPSNGDSNDTEVSISEKWIDVPPGLKGR